MRHALSPMAHTAIAVQADGVIIEVYASPDQSISDAAQRIDISTFSNMMITLRKIGKVVGCHVQKIL